jgi:hypothetical protein
MAGPKETLLKIILDVSHTSKGHASQYTNPLTHYSYER